MAKKTTEKTQHKMTRRQLAHWQEQKRRQRLLTITGISVVAAVVIFLVVGWVLTRFIPLHQTVARINDKEYNMEYYIDMLDYYSGGNINYYTYMADMVITYIQQSEMIVQEAATLGVTVTDDEVKAELKELELSKDYMDPLRASLVSEKLQDEYFDSQVPASAEQRHIYAMLLESENNAKSIKALLDAGEDFGELAATHSLETYTKSNSGDLGWRPEGVLSIVGYDFLEEPAFSLAVGTVSDPLYDENQGKSVGYWLLRVIERDGEDEEEEAHVQGILLGDRETAEEVKAKLDAGENFGTLATEYSENSASKQNEGDLDWVAPGEYGTAFDEFVFDNEIELRTLSEPVRDEAEITSGGYWLVKVTEMEDREIEDENRQYLVSKLYNDWSTELRETSSYEVENLLDEDMKSFAIEEATLRAERNSD